MTRKLPIGLWLGLVFGWLAVLTALCAVMAWGALDRVETKREQAAWVASEPFPRVQAVQDALFALRGSYRDALTERDPSRLAQVVSHYRLCRQRLLDAQDRLHAVIAGRAALAAWSRDELDAKAAAAGLLPVIDEMVGMAARGERDDAMRVYVLHVQGQSETLSAPLRRLVGTAYEARSQAEEAVIATRATLTGWLIALLAAGVLSGLAAWWACRRFLLRTLGGPLETLLARMLMLADGRLPEDDGCVRPGSVMAGVSEVAQRWRRIVGEARRMLSVVRALADRSERAASEANLAAIEASAGFAALSTALDHLGRSFDLSRETLRRSALFSDEAAQGAAEGEEAVSRALDSLAAMSERVRAIGALARQTRLLALNAAVEAAAARSAGDGLHVVAGNVRDIAESTAAAVIEVEELLSAALGGMRATGGFLTRGAVDAGELADRLAAMDRAANGQAARVTGLDETLRGMVGASSGNCDHAAQIHDMATELERQVGRLEGELAFFRDA
ncbi:methyl-accepting chemotaxis protein [Paludibacterium paludis]|uniref:Methyl-accepting transducer domain-containing protein n=1 Tax=Paludibacterium paludis TaxID=1225769 RepID=A0A918P2X4_9NEIS|nr:methyl-accepting chemotaxis protein [Paludibacterium paludis]GGY13183.1 hypothetical protein GCM10011289_15510 [Paludibacterium paludis]